MDLGWILSGFEVDLGGFWMDPGWTWHGFGVALEALFGYSVDFCMMSRNT